MLAVSNDTIVVLKIDSDHVNAEAWNNFKQESTALPKVANDMSKEFVRAYHVAVKKLALILRMSVTMCNIAAYHLARARTYRSPRHRKSNSASNSDDEGGSSESDSSDDPPAKPYPHRVVPIKKQPTKFPLAAALPRQMLRCPTEGRRAA